MCIVIELGLAAFDPVISARAAVDNTSAPLTVAQVLSGDSLILSDGRTLRLDGIQCCLFGDEGAAAKDFLRRLVDGKSLWLENIGTDRYGRITANAFVDDGQSGKIRVQGALLSQGLAFVYPPTGNEAQLDEMLQRESVARQGWIGIWAKAAYDDITAGKLENQGAKVYGAFAFVTGSVLKAERIKNKVYLNFGADWREDFTIAIAARDLRIFRDAGIDPLSYQGKMVRVRG